MAVKKRVIWMDDESWDTLRRQAEAKSFSPSQYIKGLAHRDLLANRGIDHIDGNPLNNEITNLTIRPTNNVAMTPAQAALPTSKAEDRKASATIGPIDPKVLGLPDPSFVRYNPAPKPGKGK